MERPSAMGRSKRRFQNALCAYPYYCPSQFLNESVVAFLVGDLWPAFLRGGARLADICAADGIGPLGSLWLRSGLQRLDGVLHVLAFTSILRFMMTHGCSHCHHATQIASAQSWCHYDVMNIIQGDTRDVQMQ